MSVITVPTPISVRRAATKVLTMLNRAAMGVERKRALWGEPNPQTGLRTFALPGLELSTGVRPRDAARLIGWRLPADADQRGIITVGEVATPGEQTFSEFNTGPYSRVAWAAVSQAIAFANAHESPFEPAILLIPMLYVEAVWLKAGDGSDDYICVYGKHPDAVRERVFYRDREFVAALQEIAAQRITEARRFRR